MLDHAPYAARLNALRTLYPQGDPDMVADIVRSVLTSMRGDLTGKEAALLAEVEELAQTVASARAEIAALRADDITQSHIPSATDELDAIVAHTATATDSILECCERLDTVAPLLSGQAAQTLQDVVTRIYEACSFQDITGQRITKVVTTLKAIEAKVAHIIEVFRNKDHGAGDHGAGTQEARNQEAGNQGAGDQGAGHHRATDRGMPARSPSAQPEPAFNASLLNGPQLPSAAMDQSDIDALLASFD